MRADEKKAQEAISNYIKKNYKWNLVDIQEEPNGPDTAPDYRLKLLDRNIDLEITLSGHGFLEHFDKGPIDRIKYEGSAGLDFLLKQYLAGERWLKQGEILLVTILSPIPPSKRSQTAKKILIALQKRYESGTLKKYVQGLPSSATDFSIDTPTVKHQRFG